MTLHETAGTQLVPAKPKNLPVRILRALDSAMHLNGLKRGVRDTLAELCRFISQSQPFETIFAHKSTIAGRVGISERTIYRHLSTLQQHGLIDLLEQDRKSRNGRFAVARIRITRLAAKLLGFIDDGEQSLPAFHGTQVEVTSEPSEACLKAPSTPKTLGTPGASGTGSATTGSENRSPLPINEETCEQVVHSSPSAKMAGGHTLTVPTYSKNQPLQRIENGLPIDLAWMTGKGLSRAGVFKLMGIAKRHGKRLSDIVVVVHQYLRDLKGGKLYAYLAKLATGPTDFAVAATEERQRKKMAEKAKLQVRKEENFRARFRNSCLTNSSQTRLYVIDNHARFAQIHGAGYPITVPLSDLSEWIERIENGRLVLATLATERRFLS